MNAKLPERDAEGFLLDPEDWDESVAEALAQEEELELDDTRWAILRFMRDYLAEHGVAPDVRHVTQFLAKTQGLSKKEAKALLFQTFPYGYVKQACKLAGFRKPRAWSTG